MYRWLLLVLVLLGAGPVRSEVVQGLYAATVPVPDQSEQSLQQGAAAALAEVVVKVSGSESALQNPAVTAALGQARKQVQQFVFSRDAADGGLRAKFEFNRAFVTELVKEAGLPLWTANRPRVLLWVVAEAEGKQFFVNPAETGDLAGALAQAFQHRGIPAGFPLFDLGDTAAVSLGDIWNLDIPRVEAASLRYGVEDILVGRVVESSSGRWVGDWTYLHAGEQRLGGGDAPDAQAFFQRGVGLVAEDMVARYAVAASAGPEGQLRLGITGVNSFADYASIVNWLEELELVEQAQLDKIDGERMELTIEAAVDAPRLAQLLQLNRRLQPVNPAATDLEYQWQN
ncbi:DUF2066 domain-containing protein [Haliea sp. E17]|uniref:DUF2066 domain-containing protein n=1 Tax=Haliea sp. E17 TaxID=3401576 RepID=UPI003AAA5411